MSIKTIVVTCLISASTCVVAQTNRIPETDNTAKLNLTEEWDKTFPKSDKVNHSKVTFVNRFGIMLAADMYVPKSAEGRLAAIAVCGPFGAVKEQCSGLYAQELAERGFITVAFDPSFTGESGGTPRSVASPDINTEDFSVAVDFLTTLDNVDKERIGILGICGWGGFSINAAPSIHVSRLLWLPRCTISAVVSRPDTSMLPTVIPRVMKCVSGLALSARRTLIPALTGVR